MKYCFHLSGNVSGAQLMPRSVFYLVYQRLDKRLLRDIKQLTHEKATWREITQREQSPLLRSGQVHFLARRSQVTFITVYRRAAAGRSNCSYNQPRPYHTRDQRRVLAAPQPAVRRRRDQGPSRS